MEFFLKNLVRTYLEIVTYHNNILHSILTKFNIITYFDIFPHNL